MKNILKALIMLVVSCGLASCETYDLPNTETTAVAPLDGHWICFAYDYNEYTTNPATAQPKQLYEIWSSNTTNNDRDIMWFHIGNPLTTSYPYQQVVSIKVNCDPRARTFSVTNGSSATAPPTVNTRFYRTANANYFGSPTPAASRSTTGLTVNITDGEVILNGVETTSSTATKKYFTDKIQFILEVTGTPVSPDISSYNYKYVVIGNRSTGWVEDYVAETDFVIKVLTAKGVIH